jgi:hypothetical protein
MTNMIWRRSFVKTTLVAAACISMVFLEFTELKSAEPLPSQITDEAFWKLVTTMSEPDGQFRYENFLSNEIQYQYVIPELKAATRPGGVYMGVGPEQNFTYIVALQPRIAFITDIRRQNMLELMMYKAIFELCPDRADFLSMLFSRTRPEGLTEKASADQLFRAYLPALRDETVYLKNIKAIQNLLAQKHQFGLSLTDLQNIQYVFSVFANDGPYLDYSSGALGTAPNAGMPNYSELMVANDARGTQRSFLASESNYKIMRDMEIKNLVVPIVGDFAGPKSIRAIGKYLKDHDATVTAFYLSNVEQYLYSDGKLSDFFKNAATLPMDASSTFIRTFGPNGGGSVGAGRGFQSALSSMIDVVKVCTADGGCDYSTVRQMSK